jgi:hypothetical protein
MPLFLTEISPSGDVDAVLAAVHTAVQSGGGEVIEVQVTADKSQAFVIVEAQDSAKVAGALGAASIAASELAPVRLVGADLDQVKATRPASGYLVEWDIPAGITMDQYLARKKEKSPLYAQVPETTFQRTYVREDMMKCLCFYDAPDEAAVVRAREVVSTPIDRLHKLDNSFVKSNE